MYLQNGAQFVVTNPDSADRMAGDRMQPNQGFLDQLLNKYGFDLGDTIMCGDRLDTDISFGGGKIDTLLVLSGVSLQSDVDALGEIQPTYVAANVDNAVKGNATDVSPSLHFA